MAVSYSGQINNLILTKSAYSQGEAIYGAIDFTATKSGWGIEWIPGTAYAWHVWIRAYDATGTLLDGDSTIRISSPASVRASANCWKYKCKAEFWLIVLFLRGLSSI